MELLGPDPRDAARRKALLAKRSEEEQFAKDTLAQAGIGTGIVTSQMLVDNINGDDADLIARRAAADREWTYGHVVVDEAQELTAMDWRMLIRRCPSRSFTIVGDVAQTAALGGTRMWRTTMNPLFGENNWDLYELTINYRNPKEVSELASRFASREGLYVSTVNAVRAVPDSVGHVTVCDPGVLLSTVAAHTARLAARFLSPDGTGRMAVIAPDDLISDVSGAVDSALRSTLGPKEYTRLRSQQSWDEQIMICGTSSVKGLEYDAVVVVQPGEIEAQAPSRLVAASDLYVAMTRPTQHLLVVRTKQDEASLEL
jgi:DNA helicase IV